MVINKIIRNWWLDRIKTSTVVDIDNKWLILILFITGMRSWSWHFPCNLISNFKSNIFWILFTDNFLTTKFHLFFLIFLFLFSYFWLVFHYFIFLLDLFQLLINGISSIWFLLWSLFLRMRHFWFWLWTIFPTLNFFIW